MGVYKWIAYHWVIAVRNIKARLGLPIGHNTVRPNLPKLLFKS